MSLFLLLACGGPPDSALDKDDLDGDGWTSFEGDCDDEDASVFPTAQETWYDGTDQNCDGNDDDQDGDGAAFPDDCDDTDTAVIPGTSELCDGLDNDCDGEIDDDPVDGVSGWADADGDGYGDPEAGSSGCEGGDLVDNDEDCDDGDATVNPAAEDVCDGLDNDCSGVADDGGGEPVDWYADVDADGYGDPGSVLQQCSQPEGYVLGGDDCDDADASVNPGATEDCDPVDRDCDGDPEAGAPDAGDWYSDADADGYGDDGSLVSACTQPEGTVSVGGDCDDADPGARPGAEESCDGADDDCDGDVDEDATDATDWYTDADADGWGGELGASACAAPAGMTDLAGDCDDADPAVNPDAAEDCADGIDNDCDAEIDEGGSGTAWTDADGDGYGDPATELSWSCTQPPDSVDNGADCDDGDAAVSPAAEEVCNGLDDDCDSEVDESGGASTWYADADGDAYGDVAESTVACEAPEGFVADATDCDDAAAGVNPGATESCDGLDDDCDGEIDEAGATGEGSWYPDLDGDGYGDAAGGARACEAPEGWLADGSDCDDGNPAIHPGAAELCDGVDDNCSGDSADEAGTAAFDDGSGLVDISSELAAGSASDPVVIGDQASYDYVVSSGSLHLCEGDWYLKLILASSGSELAVFGKGADATSISSGGVEAGTAGSIVAVANATMSIDGLSIVGGVGSSSSKGGAIIASQTDGSANPASPNLTLTDVIVSGNATQYGGGIAINNYGWVELVDSLVLGNEATVAGGGAWVQSSGKLSCTATSLGAAGLVANESPIGGAVYLSSASGGLVSTVGCDWGADADGDDNQGYDLEITTSKDYCWGNAADLGETIDCASGSCTASNDSGCP